jgi:hypothetical protein
MSSQIYIEPSTQVVTNIITSFIANVTSIELFTSAIISVNLYNADPNLIKTVNLPLVGDDYQNWANNDQYIIDYVAAQLGFVLAPSPPPILIYPSERTMRSSLIDPIDPIETI